MTDNEQKALEASLEAMQRADAQIYSADLVADVAAAIALVRAALAAPVVALPLPAEAVSQAIDALICGHGHVMESVRRNAEAILQAPSYQLDADRIHKSLVALRAAPVAAPAPPAMTLRMLTLRERFDVYYDATTAAGDCTATMLQLKFCEVNGLPVPKEQP